MAALRVFVSSTCVDLSAQREQIRGLLARMGYEPIMSDFSDILYDPRKHTHTSCIREVAHADIIILLIGSRFGGAAIPDAISEVDIEAISTISTQGEINDQDRYSITQLEVMRAIELGIPLFTFVDANVYAEHHTYVKNRDSEIADKITYSSINKPETARYIFEFISFIGHMSSNNAITAYRSFSEIEQHLLKQWSGLFQTLLREARDKSIEGRRSEVILEQIQDLKAAVMQSIGAGGRDIARTVLRYRGLIQFILEMRVYSPSLNLIDFNGDFNDLLSQFGVTSVEDVDSSSQVGLARLLLLLNDGSHLRVRVTRRRFEAFAVDWNEFRKLEAGTKDAVLQGVADANTFGPSMVIPFVRQTEYLDPPGDIQPLYDGWTGDQLAILKTMWADGATASEIAGVLGGVSRNAVIGKAHRLGLRARPTPIQPPE